MRRSTMWLAASRLILSTASAPAIDTRIKLTKAGMRGACGTA